MMNGVNEREFQVSVELNNIGIELMDVGAFFDAMEVMKHAISAMKHVVQPKQGVGTISSEFPAHLDSRLDDARSTLRTVRHFTSEWTNTVETDSFSTPMPIEAAHAFSALGECPDVPSAILLYNYGLVHKEFSLRTRSESSRLLEGALKLFQMAYSVLTDHKASGCVNFENMSESKLMLTYFVVNNLLLVQQKMGNHGEAHASLQILSRLGMAVMIQEQGVDIGSSTRAAPAA